MVILEVLVVLRKIDIVATPALATAKSGFPSPSISPIATDQAPAPAVKSNFVAKDVFEIVPEVAVFLNTDKLALLKFATTNSAFPSLSKSPIATDIGPDPAVKSTFV